MAAPTRRDAEINGPRLNGVELIVPGSTNTLSLLAVGLAPGVVLADGSVARGVTISGTQLRGGGIDDKTIVGALVEGESSDHKPLRLRIDRVLPAADPQADTPVNENADVLTYAVLYQWGTWSGAGAARKWTETSPWAPLCSDGGLAIPIAGRWDYHKGVRGDSRRLNSDSKVLTFACPGSAIAKCIEKMGYKPWLPPRHAPSGETVSMDALHQSCVRAVRADYCGTGDSLTTEGQLVNFYDRTDLLKDTENWQSEATWNPAGASCVSSSRLPLNPQDSRQTVQGYVAKTCLTAWSATPCTLGSEKATNPGRPAALLATENKPRDATPIAPPPKANHG